MTRRYKVMARFDGFGREEPGADLLREAVKQARAALQQEWCVEVWITDDQTGKKWTLTPEGLRENAIDCTGS